MDLTGYLRLLRKNWWLIVLAAILGGGAGFVYNAQATRQYASSVTFYISTPSSGAGTTAYQANQLAIAKVASYTELMTSEELARMVIAKGQLGLSPGAVLSRISVSSTVNTVLMKATVVDSTPSGSFAIAKALSTEFGVLVDQVDNRRTDTGTTQSVVEIRVVSGPTLKPIPISPRTTLNLGLGVAAGLVVGLVLALMRGVLDTTIRSVDVIREITGLPVLGTLTFETIARKLPVLTAGQSRSVRAESFRQLRTNLQFIDVDSPVRVVEVTSSLEAEGKSTVSINLAVVFAEADLDVLLIEADLRRPRVSTYLEIDGSIGLTNVLAGQVELAEALQTWGDPQLSVLPCGTLPPNPSELLGSTQMADLIELVRSKFDVVVIDTPPLLPVTDPAVVSSVADGVIVVARYGKTKRAQLADSIRILDQVDARGLGVVLNLAPRHTTGYSYYGESHPVTRERTGEVRRSSPKGSQTSPPQLSKVPRTPEPEAPEVAQSSGETPETSSTESVAVTRSSRRRSAASPEKDSDLASDSRRAFNWWTQH